MGPPLAVRVLIEQAENEFDDLTVCRREISWRIMKLSRAVSELSEVLNRQGKNSLPLPQPRTFAKTITAESHRHTGKQSNLMFPSKDKPALLHTGVTRACRIALMEAGGPASLHEIGERIQQRGSCDFNGCASPLLLLRQALAKLEMEGEVQIIIVGEDVCWRLTPGEDQIAFPNRISKVQLDNHQPGSSASASD